ncbi:MAG: hypothetical protein DUD28_07840, partial [Lactobacillus sp.]
DGIFRLGHEVRPNLLVLSLISLRLHGLFGLVILVLHLHCKSGIISDAAKLIKKTCNVRRFQIKYLMLKNTWRSSEVAKRGGL